MGSFLRLDHVNFNYHGLEGETLALANVSLKNIRMGNRWMKYAGKSWKSTGE